MKKLLNFLLISVVLISCKKYEDGPSFSLFSARARLTNNWKIHEQIKDGITTVIDGSSTVTETFRSNNDYSASVYYSSSNSTTGDRSATWKFIESKKTIEFSGGEPWWGNFEYHILKLTDKDFWYYVDNGSTATPYHMEFHLIPK